jgi:hypothetical protein
VETNLLYYGDKLDILRKYIPDESVDLGLGAKVSPGQEKLFG